MVTGIVFTAADVEAWWNAQDAATKRKICQLRLFPRARRPSPSLLTRRGPRTLDTPVPSAGEQVAVTLPL